MNTSTASGLPWLVALGMALLSAGTAAQTTVAIGNVRGFPGQTALVPVNVANGTNLVAAQFQITYSTGRLAAVALPTAQTAGRVVRSREVAPGVRRVVAYSLGRVLATNRAVVAQLPFAVSPTVHDFSGPITPRAVVLADRRGDSVTPTRLQSGAVFVRPAFLDEDGQAQFFFPSVSGETYRIEATSDFVRWTPISTNAASSSFLDLVDADARRYPSRFYRTALLSTGFEFRSFVLLPDGRLSAQIVGSPLATYALETSIDLDRWERSGTVTLGPDGKATTTLSGALPQQFFRLTLPGP